MFEWKGVVTLSTDVVCEACEIVHVFHLGPKAGVVACGVLGVTYCGRNAENAVHFEGIRVEVGVTVVTAVVGEIETTEARATVDVFCFALFRGGRC